MGGVDDRSAGDSLEMCGNTWVEDGDCDALSPLVTSRCTVGEKGGRGGASRANKQTRKKN